ncbi:MAG: RtcB family protein [archaeon]
MSNYKQDASGSFFIKNINNKEIKILASKTIFSKIPISALEQLESISLIKEVESPIIAQADIHPGFSVPIGTVFLSSSKNGIISPSAIGYDVNCGVRLIKTNLFAKDISKEQLLLLQKELTKLPLGLSKNGMKITKKDLDDILNTGINWCVSKKICSKERVKNIENNGCYKGADSACVSKEAKELGLVELGTLGEGNHFIDVLVVSEVFSKSLATKYKLKKDQVVILIHTGSRGLGHKVADDYNKLCENKAPFTYTKFNSKLGQNYFKGMQAAGNFAFVNREILSKKIQDVFSVIFVGHLKPKFDLVYDLCHNIVTLETIKGKEYVVHRKGATLATKNKPIILPGSMLDYSYLLLPAKGTEKTLNTFPHGMGRSLSRSIAKEKITINDLKKFMLDKGVLLGGRSENVMREEQPNAYKSSKDIISIIEKANLAKKIVSFKPIIVLTG